MVGTNTLTEPEQGTSVSLSADGNIALITAVGFRDKYDFDWRTFTPNSGRSFSAEMQTRGVNIFGERFGNAIPYKITYP